MTRSAKLSWVAAFLVIVLTRMSLIIPYNVLNYAYGLTRVPLGIYAVATAIGMLPAAALYSYLGSVADDVAAIMAGETEMGAGGKALMIGGVVLLVIAVVIVQRAAAKELEKHLEE